VIRFLYLLQMISFDICCVSHVVHVPLFVGCIKFSCGDQCWVNIVAAVQHLPEQY